MAVNFFPAFVWFLRVLPTIVSGATGLHEEGEQARGEGGEKKFVNAQQ